jgi:valyl-tRNA synthetase
MIMANMEFMRGEPGSDGTPRTTDEQLVPFRDVYFTSIIRDAQGRKMSKSLGNSPDPLDVIDQYGADAMRFTIAFLSPLGQDVLFSSEKCELGRNFANKIWNAGRFLLMNKAELGSPSGIHESAALPEQHLDLADRWILSRLNHTIGSFNTALTEFHLNEASKALYDFIWHDFCDWYVELVKTRFYGDEPEETKKIVLGRALWIFDRALRLLHPVMPFVTEELWQHLTERNGASLMVTEFPVVEDRWIDQKTEDDMAYVQDVINAVRNIRGENNIAPSKEIRVQVRHASETSAAILNLYEKYLNKLGRVSAIERLTTPANPKLASSAVVAGSEIFVPLAGLIDLDAERGRLEKEIARLQQVIEATGRKLSNPSFVERAPKDVVDKEREKLTSFQATIEKLKANLTHFQ